MKDQRQDFQHHLLAVSQRRSRTLPTLLIDSHKPVPQPPKRFAIYPFFKIQGYPGSLGGHFGSGGELLESFFHVLL